MKVILIEKSKKIFIYIFYKLDYIYALYIYNLIFREINKFFLIIKLINFELIILNKKKIIKVYNNFIKNIIILYKFV